MKKILALVILLSIITGAMAQVDRFSGNFDEAKKAAKKNGKILLINCTTPTG